MDQRLCLGAAHRRLARPAHVPRPHSGDEWRELSAQTQQAAAAYRDRRDGGSPSRYRISDRLTWAGPAQAELRDVTLCSGSYAARSDRPGLAAAIPHTITP